MGGPGSGRRFGGKYSMVTRRRNEEIRARYEAGEPSTKLSRAYGITRERVCQILRRSNTIEMVHGRRIMAREALRDEVARIKAEVKRETEAKVQRALELIRNGESQRKARAIVTGDKSFHTNMDTIINAACKKAGIVSKHGRWRDFSYRKNRLKKLLADGNNLTQAITKMRAEGSQIHHGWVTANMPEVLPSGTKYDGRKMRSAPAKTPRTELVWGAKTTAKMLSLYFSGATGQQIADILGSPYSRSAVLGKIHRLRKSGELKPPVSTTGVTI